MTDTSVDRITSTLDSTTVQRVLLSFAAGSLLLYSFGIWQLVISGSGVGGALYAVTFPILILIAGAGCVVRNPRVLDRLGLVVLGFAVLTQVHYADVAVRGHTTYQYDESVLLRLASRAFAAGHNPYREHWQAAVSRVGSTELMNGKLADRFGYPGLGPLLGASVAKIAPGWDEITIVGLVALLVTAVLVHLMLPRALKPLAVLVVFTISPLPALAQYGYPSMIAVPFLVVALWRWPLTGRGGRLGRLGTGQAVCLGLAAAAQQITWFFAAFLVVALWRLRRGDLDRGPAARLVTRYASVVVLAFIVPNLPFIVMGPRTWLRGVLDPLRQHAFFNGAGIALWTWRVIGGSGSLKFYGYAGLLVVLALLVGVALYPRMLAPAIIALPWVSFWFTLRSLPLYYQTFVPLFVLSAIVNKLEWFAAARPLAMPRVPRIPDRVVRLAPVGAVVVSAAACLGVAGASSAPLHAQVSNVHDVQAYSGPRLTQLTVHVANESDQQISPHFLTNRGSRQSQFWRIVNGPSRLDPGQRAIYVLRPQKRDATNLGTPDVLWIVSDRPETLSSGSIPSYGTRIPAPGAGAASPSR